MGRCPERPLTTDILPAPVPAWRRALGILLPVLGLVLLVLVLRRVPWEDRLHLAEGTVLTGTVSEEDAETVLFAPSGEEALSFDRGDLAVRDHGLPAVEYGLRALAGRLRWGPTLGAILCVALMISIAVTRWRMLLRAQGLEVSVKEVGSLTFLGNFLNQVVPGGIMGGDVVKAVYLTRSVERSAKAAVTVFVDRVSGLTGTVLLASMALIPWWDDPRFRSTAILAYSLLAAGSLFATLVFSHRVRDALRVGDRVEALPVVGGILGSADRAVQMYRDRKGVVATALLLSLGVHGSWSVANWLLGGMIGIDLPLTTFLAVIPAILVVSAIPLLPGGWGVGEAAFIFFLGAVGVPPAEAVALSLVGRSLQLAWSLPGGIVFLSRRV